MSKVWGKVPVISNDTNIEMEPREVDDTVAHEEEKKEKNLDENEVCYGFNHCDSVIVLKEIIFA